MDDAEISKQVEWFHWLAKQPLDQVALQATEENRVRVAQYVAMCVPGHSMPENLSPEEFARSVLDLRENERGWNQALMKALIEADDLHAGKEPNAAAASLRAFSELCPWKLFEPPRLSWRPVGLSQATTMEV